MKFDSHMDTAPPLARCRDRPVRAWCEPRSEPDWMGSVSPSTTGSGPRTSGTGRISGRRGSGLVILPGIEVTGRRRHVLCYMASHRRPVRGAARDRRGERPGRFTSRRRVTCVAAHPNRWNQPFEKLRQDPEMPELDGIEVLSNNMDPPLRAQSRGIAQEVPAVRATGQQRFTLRMVRRLLLHRLRRGDPHDGRPRRRDPPEEGRGEGEQCGPNVRRCWRADCTTRSTPNWSRRAHLRPRSRLDAQCHPQIRRALCRRRILRSVVRIDR